MGRDCENVVDHECLCGGVTSRTATARGSRVTADSVKAE